MRDKFRLKKIQRETKRTRPTHVWKKKDTTMESAEQKVELAVNNMYRINDDDNKKVQSRWFVLK
jgi:hypothetical protein